MACGMGKPMGIPRESEEQRYEIKETSLFLESNNPFQEDIGKIYMSYAFLAVYKTEAISRPVFLDKTPYLPPYLGKCCNK